MILTILDLIKMCRKRNPRVDTKPRANSVDSDCSGIFEMGHRVRNLSIAQYVSAFSIIILEIVFVILAADPEKRTRCRHKLER